MMLLTAIGMRAQQDVSFGHYWAMESSFNPGSVGKEDKLNFQMILINKDDEVTCTYGLIDEFSLENPFYTLRFIE